MLARVGPKEGPGRSHYSWNGSRVNTRRSAIGHCADLRQETEHGWGWETGAAPGTSQGGIWGENSRAILVGGGGLRMMSAAVEGRRGSRDKIQTALGGWRGWGVRVGVKTWGQCVLWVPSGRHGRAEEVILQRRRCG